jgi:hypothetical protein
VQGVHEPSFWLLRRLLGSVVRMRHDLSFHSASVSPGFGYGLAAGGQAYSLATVGMHVGNFVFNAIPGFEDYCLKKYKEEWTNYEKVPWKPFPGIY